MDESAPRADGPAAPRSDASPNTVAESEKYLTWAAERLAEQISSAVERESTLEKRATWALGALVGVLLFAVKQSAKWHADPTFVLAMLSGVLLVLAGIQSWLILKVRFRDVVSGLAFWNDERREWLPRHMWETACLALLSSLEDHRRVVADIGNRLRVLQIEAAFGILAVVAVTIWGELTRP